MMTAFRRGLAALFVAALSLPALSQTARAVEIERVVSPGGIEAWLVRDEKNPIIAVDWSFDGGTELDPADKLGLTAMAMSLLTEGAGTLDSQAFSKQLEDNSIALSFGAGRDAVFGSLTTLVETKDLAFDLAALAMTKPRFDADAVQRVQGQFIAGAKRSLANPGYVAQVTFQQTLFPDHPYGRPGNGFVKTLSAITAADLKAVPATRLTRDRLKVGVSGAITAQELGPVLDKMFGGLPAKGPETKVPAVEPAGAGTITQATRPIPQTVMIMGHKGLDRQDPDWYAATVLNYVLGGGGFSSRLMEEVREKRGLTYGVSSGLQSLRNSNIMVVSAQMANANAGKAKDLIQQIWGEVAEKGITEKELADAKTYLTGSYPLQFTSNDSIAGILLAVQRDRLGIDYIGKRNSLIQAVTMDDVKRVARRLLDPKQLAVVVVGQPEGIIPTARVDGPS